MKNQKRDYLGRKIELTGKTKQGRYGEKVLQARIVEGKDAGKLIWL